MPALSPLITSRWSPYAFCPKTRVEPEKLEACFEAARWAPSSYNEQPWHFSYAEKNSDPLGHAKLVSFMVEFNQQWAQHAPVLGVISTHKESELFKKFNSHAQYDCGAAMAFFTFQATELGLSVHQMAGFDPLRATSELIQVSFRNSCRSVKRNKNLASAKNVLLSLLLLNLNKIIVRLLCLLSLGHSIGLFIVIQLPFYLNFAHAQRLRLPQGLGK